MNSVVSRAKEIALPDFDLSSIFILLQRADKDVWTVQLFQEVEREYRRFLALCKQDLRVSLVPSRLIDQVWHQHILSTKKYAEDCQSYFGRFLHHHPSQKPNEDIGTWERTLWLYEDVFGEQPGPVWRGENAACDADVACSDCTTCRTSLA